MWSLPDTRPYRPLEFQDRYAYKIRQSDDMKCVWVGIAAIVIIYLMNRETSLRRRPMVTLDSISGLLTRINPIRAVSSRLTRPVTTGHLIDACEVWPEFKCGMVSLIDSVEAKNSLPPPPVDDTTKQDNLNKLMSFVESKENRKACIIIFAHWCPHCKTLLKELIEQANSGSGMDHKYLLVNGESVSSEAFVGEKALFPLNHYPTILCKIGTMGKEAQSLQNANEILESTSDDPSPDTSPPSETAVTDEVSSMETVTEEAVGGMLDSLF